MYPSGQAIHPVRSLTKHSLSMWSIPSSRLSTPNELSSRVGPVPHWKDRSSTRAEPLEYPNGELLIALFPNPLLGETGVQKLPSGNGPGKFLATVDGLEKGRKYFIRAYARNSEGIAYGSELTHQDHRLPPNHPLGQMPKQEQRQIGGPVHGLAHFI